MINTIPASILALVFAVLISPNFIDNSQGQRTDDLPLDKSIERDGISLHFPSDWKELAIENENQLIRISSPDGNSFITINRYDSGPLNEVLTKRVNEFVKYLPGIEFYNIEVNSDPFESKTIQSQYIIQGGSIEEDNNSKLLHYEKGHVMNDHPLMITLYYAGLDESYYNNSPIADSIIESLKIDLQAFG
ncbi:MAG: hypothetical protein QOK67_09700 [Nitrososphaeraceae archaeon]|nr:hypothetical protein [Nitrososphaeraceae archaeon]